jgi:2-O-methyltransferase
VRIYSKLPAILSKPNPVVLELGANDGTDTEKILEYCKGRPSYYAFEPDPRSVAKIKRRNLGVVLVEAAVGGEKGSAILYQFFNKSSPDDGSGPTSILKPKTHDKRLPHLSYRANIEVPVVTLDEFSKEHGITSVDFMWVDIQGSEYGMIQGGAETLRRTSWLFMEAVHDRRYHGQKVRHELLSSIPGSWEMVGDWPNDVLLKNSAV